MEIAIGQGDITEEESDCIVNSINEEFDLSSSGPLGKIILQKGGNIIQEELDLYSHPKLRMTEAGLLPCLNILHGAFSNDADSLKQEIESVLRKADQEQMQSISFPAIGTGGKGMDVHTVAKTMGEAFASFEDHVSNISRINVVVFLPEHMEVFEQALTEKFSTDNTGLYSLVARYIGIYDGFYLVIILVIFIHWSTNMENRK